mmetsp:Transcript_8025/g.26427  ORF Transcript_8025/g.26427 Transcript_8025/m.26427 type:complete len:232 (-) Transcript_8025:2408-3103(-)
MAVPGVVRPRRGGGGQPSRPRARARHAGVQDFSGENGRARPRLGRGEPGAPDRGGLVRQGAARGGRSGPRGGWQVPRGRPVDPRRARRLALSLHVFSAAARAQRNRQGRLLGWHHGHGAAAGAERQQELDQVLLGARSRPGSGGEGERRFGGGGGVVLGARLGALQHRRRRSAGKLLLARAAGAAGRADDAAGAGGQGAPDGRAAGHRHQRAQRHRQAHPGLARADRRQPP